MLLFRHALLIALKMFVLFAIVVLFVSWWAYTRDVAGVGEENSGGWLLIYLMIPVMLASQVLGFAMVLPEVTMRNIFIGSVFYFLVCTFLGLWWAWFRQTRRARASQAKRGGS